MLVRAFLGNPGTDGVDVRLFLRGEARGVVGHRAGDGHEMDADDLAGICLGQA
jgi:hypothetical protein